MERFFQGKDIGKTISGKFHFYETGSTGQPDYRAAGLEMGIEDDLLHKQDTSGLKRFKDLLECRFPVRDLTQHSYQHSPVKVVAREPAFSDTDREKPDIGEV
jgi:hypothetical protein